MQSELWTSTIENHPRIEAWLKAAGAFHLDECVPLLSEES